MKKLTLLTTTALFAGYMAFSTPAQAETQGWFSSMKQSVQTWFAGEPESNAEVEAYLDEVTIAVPPMTGAEAAAIQPAAGTYVEDEIEVQGQTPTNAVAPGSLQYQNESSFDTEFDGTQGSVTAFGDIQQDTGADVATIMPAAGDAEEMNDEAVIVVENETDAGATMDADTETMADAEVEAAADADVATETEADTNTDMAPDVLETSADATVTEEAEVETNTQTPAEEAVEMYENETSDMDVSVDVDDDVTTGTNAGDVGVDASVDSNVGLEAQE